MWEAYERVREKMGHHLRRQKEIYDRKAHGCLYNKGDKVPKGTSRKFHKPWSGPYTVVKRICDITYRIQHAHHPRKRMVVHLDRLKPFNGDIQEKSSKGNKPPVQSSETPSSPLPTSHTLKLYDDDDDNDEVANAESSAGSATQTHRAPARFDDYISH